MKKNFFAHHARIHKNRLFQREVGGGGLKVFRANTDLLYPPGKILHPRLGHSVHVGKEYQVVKRGK